MIEKLTIYAVHFHVDLPVPEAFLNGRHWKQNAFRRGYSRLCKLEVNYSFDRFYTVCYAFYTVHENDNKSSHETLCNLFYNSQHFLAFSFLRKGMYLDAVLMLTTSRSTTYSFRSLHADNMNDLINHFLKYSNSSNIAGVDNWLTRSFILWSVNFANSTSSWTR